MTVVYIAGPYRASTPWQIQEQIRRARLLSLEVWKLGAVALCPHANTALFDGECSDDVWLAGDLELLKRCDAVLLTVDWARSSGARAEKVFAEQHGIPIYKTFEDFRHAFNATMRVTA